MSRTAPSDARRHPPGSRESWPDACTIGKTRNTDGGLWKGKDDLLGSHTMHLCAVKLVKYHFVCLILAVVEIRNTMKRNYDDDDDFGSNRTSVGSFNNHLFH